MPSKTACPGTTGCVPTGQPVPHLQPVLDCSASCRVVVLCSTLNLNRPQLRMPRWFRSCRWLISVAARKALPFVTAWWLIKAQKVSQGRQIRKHGYRKLLPDMGLATTPQQASAVFSMNTAWQLFCVVSQFQCAGNLSFRTGNNYRVVVPPFKDGYHSSGPTSRQLVRHCNFAWLRSG